MTHHSKSEVLDLIKSFEQNLRAAYHGFKITCKDPDLNAVCF